MRLQVDADSPMPLHAQIAEQVQLAVARGELAPGDRLPTVRELAVELRVNSNTVARVYADLERQGVLEARRGLGTFVRPHAGGPAASRRAEQVLDRRIVSLCRSFVQACAREGFTLRDIMHALRELASGGGGAPPPPPHAASD